MKTSLSKADKEYIIVNHKVLILAQLSKDINCTQKAVKDFMKIAAKEAKNRTKDKTDLDTKPKLNSLQPILNKNSSIMTRTASEFADSNIKPQEILIDTNRIFVRPEG